MNVLSDQVLRSLVCGQNRLQVLQVTLVSVSCWVVEFWIQWTVWFYVS